MPNGIPHPYEDYCISVDLTVKFDDRNSLGPVGKSGNVGKVYTFSSDRGTINFIGGTNGFLTTNFTDIYASNPEKNTNECLGIESINIAYNSWYVPQVSIKFVDVRGASLMGPQEQGYVNTLRSDMATGHKTNTAIEGGSFFKALFSFPYPMFKLKVKGFYGKEVTYNLSVEDFQANFNSDNGNFEVDVRFIGYMFGVYTDIPMNYLMVAPYIKDVGDVYWEQEKKNGRFTYDWGSDETRGVRPAAPFFTYPKLIEAVEGINFEPPVVQGDDNSNLIEKRTKLQNKINALRELKDTLYGCLNSVFDVGWDICKRHTIKLTEEEKAIYHKYEEKDFGGIIDKDKLKYPEGTPGYAFIGISSCQHYKCGGDELRQYVKDQTGFSDLYNEFINKIRLYNDKYGESLSVLCEEFGFSSKNFFRSAKIMKPGELWYAKNQGYDSEGGLGYQKINAWVKETIDKDLFTTSEELHIPRPLGYITSLLPDRACYLDEWVSVRINGMARETRLTISYPEYYGKGDLPEWLYNIDKKIEEEDKKLREVTTEIANRVNNSISKQLGFPVSVWNAFKMAFGHMETFMEVFYHYLREIKNQQDKGARSLDKLNVPGGVKNTDLPSNFKGKSQVPPFTLFYEDVTSNGGIAGTAGSDSKKKVVMWPGDLINNGVDTAALPEIDFVNRLINAAKTYGEIVAQYEKVKESNAKLAEEAGGVRETTQEYVPTTIYDLAHFGGRNPYSYIVDINSGNKHWEAMAVTFYTRFFQWYLTHYQKPSSDDAYAFGCIEAYNFFKAYPTIPFSIKSRLIGWYNKSTDKEMPELMKSYLSGSYKEDDKNFYDLGQDMFNDHFIKVVGDDVYYDWMKPCSYDKDINGGTVHLDNAKHMPISNVNPLYINTRSIYTTNNEIALLSATNRIFRYEPVVYTSGFNFVEVSENEFNNPTSDSPSYVKHKNSFYQKVEVDVNKEYNTDTAYFIETEVKNFDKVELEYDSVYKNQVKDTSVLNDDVKGTYNLVGPVSGNTGILPNFKPVRYILNIDGNQVDDTGNTQAVAIVNSRNWLTSAKGVSMPSENETNNKGFYLNSMSFISIYSGGSIGTEAPLYELYGSPVFYAQNNIKDAKQRKYAKAFLLATGVPIRGNPYYKERTSILPLFLVLWEGAHWYRRKWMEEHNGEDLIALPSGYLHATANEMYAREYKMKNEYSTGANYIRDNEVLYVIDEKGKSNAKDDKVRYAAITNLERSSNDINSMISFFESWVEGVQGSEGSLSFEVLNDYFELKWNGLNDVELKKLIEKYDDGKNHKMGTVFNYYGSFNRDFYDKDGDAHVKNHRAFELRVCRVNNIQSDILDSLRNYVVMLNTSLIRDDEEAKNMLVEYNSFRKATHGFLKTLNETYKAQLENASVGLETEGLPPYDPVGDKDVKIATYQTLKNLYDRWICSVENYETWRIGSGEKSEFTHFKFIDGFYRDIRDRIPVNMTYICELASEMMATSNITNDATNLKYQGKSFYEFLASICQKNQMMLLSLPMENEFTDPEGIKDMFDVKSYSRMDSRDTSCFVCLYSNKPSQYLEVDYENEEYMYASDGFNIANANGEIYEMVDLLPQFCDNVPGAYKIPAFGVTYGKQSQSIFKKVNVNMQNPQVTEASIAATQLIASKQSDGANKTTLYGQDLYRIYSNYSYTSSVEMLGNAQVMPLTYYQLNNIPLFRGTYMIINIEHSITAGDMTTKFTGVRMSRYENPLVTDNALLTDVYKDSPDYKSNGQSVQNAGMYPGLSDEELTAIRSTTMSGEHKYTIEIRDLLWSDTAYSKWGADFNKPGNDPDAERHPERFGAAAVLARLQKLQTILQGVQDAWVVYCSQHSSEPWAAYDGLYISSGLRVYELNKAVGSKPDSHHRFGFAADVQLCKFNTDKKQPDSLKTGRHNGDPTLTNKYTWDVFIPFVINYFESTGQDWDQLIREKNSKGSKWMHISYERPNGDHRKQKFDLTA